MTHPPSTMFHVPGAPQPWRRARLNARGGRVVAFHDKRSESYADFIRWAWQAAGATAFDDQPVALHVTAVYPRPKTHLKAGGELSTAGRRATLPSRTDVDNLAKAVMDALNGLAWADDRQVTELYATKVWEGELPAGVHVTISAPDSADFAA